MFSVIRHYHFDAKNGAEIDGKIRESFVPLIKKAKGFVRYYWLDTGKGEGASLSVFQDKAGADESARVRRNRQRPPSNSFIERAQNGHLHSYAKTHVR
jgi:hypothetical protein